MIDCIIFDWGGVLGPNNNRYAAKKLAREFCINETELFNYLDSEELKYQTTNDYEEYYIKASKIYGIPAEVIKDTLNNVHAGTNFEIVKVLKKAGYKTALLSDQIKPRAEWLKKEYDLSIFDKIFFSCDTHLTKSSIDTFIYIARQLGFDANKCLFVDDREININNARKVGLNCIHLTNENDLIKELENFDICLTPIYKEKTSEEVFSSTLIT